MTAETRRAVELRADAAFRLPGLPGEPLPGRVLISTYYDTPAGSLTRASISLRRRQEQTATSWRLELPTEDGRIELEEPVASSAVPDEFVALLAAHLHLGRLLPVATLRSRRAGLIYEVAASRVSVSHDRVEVIDGVPGADDFAFIRAELLTGDADALEALVERLTEAGAEVTRRRPGRDLVPGLAAPVSREQGAWFAEQLDDILANDPGTRLGVDPEHLHAHRVAIRRLRAALREEPMKTELGWIGGALGAVRDLDVLSAHLREESTTLDPNEQAVLRPVLTRLARRRTRARAELVEALESPRYFALLDALEQVAAAPFSSTGYLTALAAGQFRKLRREMRQAGPDPSDDVLHELRKRAKRTRYAAERARKAGDATLRSVVDHAKELQDVLGAHQDAVIAELELRELLGEAATTLRSVAMGRLIERERAKRALAVERWPDAWRSLERVGKKTFRRSARPGPKVEPVGDEHHPGPTDVPAAGSLQAPP